VKHTRKVDFVVTTLALVVSVGLVPSQAQAQSSLAGTHLVTCTSRDLRAAISATTTLPGGTMYAVSLTNSNVKSKGCTVSGGLTAQFLASTSTTVATPASSPSLTDTRVLRPTFAAHASVATMQGVLCTTQQATSLRLSLADATRVVQLPEPIEVCVDAGTEWTSVSGLTLPYPAPCAIASLRTTLRRDATNAGVRYFRIVFTNVTRNACTLQGTPRVQAVIGASHRAVGPPAAATRRLGWSGGPVNLAARTGRAHSVFGATMPSHYAPLPCTAARATGLVVTLRRTQRVLIPASLIVCTKMVSTKIGPISP